jgi:hypothetical protein
MKRILAIILSTTALIVPACAETAGKWEPIDVKDGLEGVVGSGASLEGTAEGDRSSKQFVATLAVACVKDKTVLTFTYEGGFVHFTSYTTAKYRIDERPIQSLTVATSSNHVAFGMWNGTGVELLKSLKGAKQIKVQSVDSLIGTKLTFTFNVSNAAEALAPIAAKCGWKL